MVHPRWWNTYPELMDRHSLPFRSVFLILVLGLALSGGLSSRTMSVVLVMLNESRHTLSTIS